MAVTITPASETIDGVATLVLNRGEGTQIVCDGTNWQTGNKKTMRGYAENVAATAPRPIATGSNSVAIGSGSFACTASATASIALGQGNATGSNSLAIGADPSTAASSLYATAIGLNSSGGGAKAVTGNGAMALGGSYASGTDSFAAAVANNTSTYGATSTNAVAIGATNKASGSYSTSVGGGGNISSSNWSTALGGRSCTAAYDYSIAYGYLGTPNVIGKVAFGNISAASAIGSGGVGWGTLSLYRATTDATASVLVSSGSVAGATNQLVLPNNSAYAFSILIVARQSAAGGTASAAWQITGLIRQEGTAASTTLVASTITTISNVPAWTIAVSADTTNGGLAVTATGAAATNIRWVATAQTSEIIYA